MKYRPLFLIILLLFTFSCKKNKENVNVKILGTWKATTFSLKYSDPSNGINIDTTIHETGTFTFFADSTFVSTIPDDGYCNLSKIVGTSNYIPFSDNTGIDICFGQGFTGISTYTIGIIDAHNLTIEEDIYSNGVHRDEKCNFIR